MWQRNRCSRRSRRRNRRRFNSNMIGTRHLIAPHIIIYVMLTSSRILCSIGLSRMQQTHTDTQAPLDGGAGGDGLTERTQRQYTKMLLNRNETNEKICSIDIVDCNFLWLFNRTRCRFVGADRISLSIFSLDYFFRFALGCRLAWIGLV